MINKILDLFRPVVIIKHERRIIVDGRNIDPDSKEGQELSQRIDREIERIDRELKKAHELFNKF